MVAEELKQGKLVQCLSEYELPTRTLYAIYPERNYMPPKVRVFIDMLKAWLSNSTFKQSGVSHLRETPDNDFL